MMLHPLLSNLDDDYYYFTPRSYQESMRRAMALEDMRRRAELERYYRAQENARRFRNHPQFGDDEIYQTLLQRQALQREAERQDYHHALRYLRGEEDDDGIIYHRDPSSSASSQGQRYEDHGDQGPMYRLMRGPDGRIYRIPIHRTNAKVPSSRLQAQMNERPSTPELQTKNQEESVKVTRDTIEQRFTEKLPKKSTELQEYNENEKTEMDTPEETTMKETPSSNYSERATKKSVAVIVEDASDNEEENDLKSPWRNRRPSPGEWMEPVAVFDKIPR